MGRAGLVFVVLALVLIFPVYAQDDLAAGKILVADKDLKDPNFDQTVIYLITYDEQGAVGLVLNRETDTPVTQILKGMREASGRKDFVFSGGPVENESVLALHHTTTKSKGVHQISRDVYAVLDEEALKEALKGADSNGLRFYLGYAGWGRGQLEHEIDAGAWSVMPGDAKTVFDSDPDTLWDRLNRRLNPNIVKHRAPRLRRQRHPVELARR